jgi:predicted nucleic acid-binding protein
MKKVFIDTNILLDLIADRRPFSKHAISIFKHAEKKNIQLYTSSHTMATTHYMLQQYMDDKKLRRIMLSVLDYLNIIAINKDMIKKGLQSRQKDFEDALQLQSAYSIKDIDCLITRNRRDYNQALIPILSPDEFTRQLK